MRRVVKMVTMALVVTIILIVALAGAVFADNPEKGKMNQSQTGDCVCDGGECLPAEHYYNYDWSEKGPHGAQHGKVIE